MRRLRAALARRRPTSRRGIVKGILAGGALVALLAVASIALVVAVPWIYGEYGFHPEANARTWAALTPRYADAVLCARCHEAQYAPWQNERHAGVTCESCHGPLAEHAATAPLEAPAGSLGLAKPGEDLCVVCHEKSPAKPEAFAQVDLAEHYTGVDVPRLPRQPQCGRRAPAGHLPFAGAAAGVRDLPRPRGPQARAGRARRVFRCGLPELPQAACGRPVGASHERDRRDRRH